VEELRKKFAKIPWASFGRRMPISELARSIVPVGNFRVRLPSGESAVIKTSDEADFGNHIMDIQGTAFQVGRGKLLTCWHVCKALNIKEGFAYVQSTSERNGKVLKCYWPVGAQFSFTDPRTKSGNKDIDVGTIICPAISNKLFHYDVPIVKWGDSTEVGVGDSVLIGGYPLGRDMFLALSTNRGIVQPTFYDGIISAVIPATKPTETRLLQISSIAIGGISGGVVCNPNDGAVLGMVTSGLESPPGHALPITYAIPSEVLQPYADAISFKGADGEIWR
jgi:Trypsin-like peptidase domain